MCAHFLKFVGLFVLLFVCGGRPYTLDEWTSLPFVLDENWSRYRRVNISEFGRLHNKNMWRKVIGRDFIAAEKSCERCGTQTKSRDWDYLQFVVQWPQSVCLKFNHSGNHSHHGKTCIIPSSIRHWTIHGTWPSKVSKNITPECCNTSWTFSLDEISDLLPELNQSWPNLYVGSALGSFWCGEWGKHGTCCASLPALYGEHNYFSKTMDFRKKFDIDKALSDAGIVPSSSARYKLADIQQALRSAIGVTPDIQCFSLSTNKSSPVHYLWEIRLCLDKTLSPIYCPHPRDDPGSAHGRSNNACSTEISLPPIEQ